MGMEINGNSGRPPHEAVEASKSQATPQANNQTRGNAGVKPGSSNNDQVNLSNQAAQLQTLEAEIANLPVVDTQRVQDVQRTLATGSFQIEPAQVADKLLSFEAGLAEAG
jgi:negative regulator of flagellin synthesis FlgM